MPVLGQWPNSWMFWLKVYFNGQQTAWLHDRMDGMRMMSWQPYSKTIRRRPCWCTKPIVWEFNSFLMWTLSFVPINLHGYWTRSGINFFSKLSFFSKILSNGPYSYSRWRTGTSLQVRLMRRSLFKCKLHTTLFNMALMNQTMFLKFMLFNQTCFGWTIIHRQCTR